MQLKINGHTIETEDYVKKWTDWGLSTIEATDEQIIHNVQELYRLARLAIPRVNVIREFDEFRNIQYSLKQSAGRLVWQSVEQSVGQSAGRLVWQLVWQSVGQLVWQLVWQSVGQSVGQSVEQSVGKFYWADDLAFAEIFSDTKVLSQKKTKELEMYKKLLETQSMGFLFEKVAYILPNPILRMDLTGKLHSERECAVQWGASGLYFLHGVNFPKDLWRKVVSRSMKFEEILAIEDVDQRKQAMKYGDIKEFLKYTNAKEVSSFVKYGAKDGRAIHYWLFKLPTNNPVFEKEVTYALYEDSMLGPAELHMQAIPPGIANTVQEGMAWKISTDYYTVTPAEWEKLQLDVTFS